jgi:hypothetical protein
MRITSELWNRNKWRRNRKKRTRKEDNSEKIEKDFLYVE